MDDNWGSKKRGETDRRRTLDGGREFHRIYEFSVFFFATFWHGHGLLLGVPGISQVYPSYIPGISQVYPRYMGVSIVMGVPTKWMVFVRENPIRNGWFRGPPIYGKPHISYISPVCPKFSWISKVRSLVNDKRESGDSRKPWAVGWLGGSKIRDLRD